jgi:hypothetical protein
VIHLGDYIDLGSLSVAPTPVTAADAGKADGHRGKYEMANNFILANEHGAALRLIVVGINSLNRVSVKPSSYVVTPHVVFQFQNLSALYRIDITGARYSEGARYSSSDMRNYLLNYYLPALNEAGVPNDLMWTAPRGLSSSGYYVANSKGIIEELTDKLWLPTEVEMFGGKIYSAITNANYQAYFEYYSTNEKRIKYSTSSYSPTNVAWGYYLGGVSADVITVQENGSTFEYFSNIFSGIKSDGSACSFYVANSENIAPAFVIN